jgi:hypothetical protein
VTPLYPQKLALTSPTGGGRSVGIVRSRTKATESFIKTQHFGMLNDVTLSAVDLTRNFQHHEVLAFLFFFADNSLDKFQPFSP